MFLQHPIYFGRAADDAQFLLLHANTTIVDIQYSSTIMPFTSNEVYPEKKLTINSINNDNSNVSVYSEQDKK